MTGVFIVAAKRTPFGAFGGKFKDISATKLALTATVGALEAAKLDPKAVDSFVFGNVMPTSTDGAYLPRHVALKAGGRTDAPAHLVGRLCGSGFQSIVTGALEIKGGDANIVVAGGAENMSQAPYTLYGSRWGTRLGVDLKLQDSLWATLTDSHAGCPMAITAENLAEKYNISMEDCNNFALQSQQRWGQAHAAGAFAAETAPVEVKGKKGPQSVEVDEHPRPETTIEGLMKLPALFKKDGTVNAGNASGICDGAGAVVLSSESGLADHSLKPLARIVSYHVEGVDPTVMGIGPVPAIQGALKKAGKTLDDMDLIEVNEAFAAQFLAVQKELGLPDEKTNVNGGAIALGHPVGASGSRIMAHLAHELHRTGKNLAIGSACIGGGQGIAIVIERV